MNKKKIFISIFAIVILLNISLVQTEVLAEEDDGDQFVKNAQQWLEDNYENKYSFFPDVNVDGHTGGSTMDALTMALQIELGLGSSSDGKFGPTTTNLCPTISMDNPGLNINIITILQHGLFCKGYGAYDEYGVFGENTKNAIIKLQKDAGLTGTGIVTPMIFEAVLNTDALVLVYNGDENIRSIQQTLNRDYNEYFGIMPCDGIYGRSTNKALIYALQALEGLKVGTADGIFGETTTSLCPSLYKGDQNKFIPLLKYVLYCNNYGTGDFETMDNVYDSVTANKISEFQKFMCLEVTGNATKETLLSLFTSCGDQSRYAPACDTSTRLTKETIDTLLMWKINYVGRYLTNVEGSSLDKKMTKEEVDLIINSGLGIIPIFQTYGGEVSYYSESQGIEDANDAIEAANNLGFPYGTTIYFAVDYDAYDYDVDTNIGPYFRGVATTIQNNVENLYNVGIYAPRNICSRVCDLNYATSSYVSNASKSFSGNLGFTMPENWAFDQFLTDKWIGEGDGLIAIDKVGYSGRNQTVLDITKSQENCGGNANVTISR